jgi:hypothetical protein
MEEKRCHLEEWLWSRHQYQGPREKVVSWLETKKEMWMER